MPRIPRLLLIRLAFTLPALFGAALLGGGLVAGPALAGAPLAGEMKKFVPVAAP
jgi:hypothetical protein